MRGSIKPFIVIMISMSLILSLLSCSIRGNINDRSISVKTAKTAPLDAEPGVCYDKSKVQAKSAQIEALVYTGTDIDNKWVTHITTTINQPAKWLKKKKIGLCRKPESEDCLRWVLERTKQPVSYYTVTDTTMNKEFELQYLEADNPIPHFNLEWRSVVCEKNIHKAIPEIQLYLIEHQYELPLPLSGLWDEYTQNQLFLFQEDNLLPIGNINHETLDYMGIVLDL